MMAQHLTGRAFGEREKDVLAFLLKHCLDHGKRPTYRELSNGTGLEIKTVRRIVTRLERRGIAQRAQKSCANQVLGYKAEQVLSFVRAYSAKHGRAPDYGEICSNVGIGSKGEVSRIVNALERRGLLSRVGRGRSRRIQV